MNCCNDFGQCTHGDGCPVHRDDDLTATIKAASHRRCDTLGVCNGNGDCNRCGEPVLPQSEADGLRAAGLNVWYADDDAPIDDDEPLLEPYSPAMMISAWAMIVVLGLSSLALMAVGAGTLWQHFSAVLA